MVRADVEECLWRLRGKTLLCDCSRGDNDCWAGVLYLCFIDVFPSASLGNLVDSSGSTGDVGKSDGQSGCPRNSDIMASAMQPTRNKFPQLIEDGLTPKDHLDRALNLEHPFVNAEPPTDHVKNSLAWDPDYSAQLIKRRADAVKAFQDLTDLTLKEGEWTRKLVNPGVARVLEAYGLKNRPISEVKSPPPSDVFSVIGVQIILKGFPNSDPLIMVTVKRVQTLDLVLFQILEQRALMSGQAASLSGKRGFAVSAAFGNLGRAQIRPIITRVCSKAKFLIKALEACIWWWRRFLPSYKPRPDPTQLRSLSVLISYSDGEGKRAGVGVALWAPWRQFPVAAYTRVPDCIREMWAAVDGRSDLNDIFLVEAVGPLLLLKAIPKLMRRCLWIHFVDNTTAEASLISGTSTLAAGSHVVALTWEECAGHEVWPYDRVESEANPVDKLSRGESNGPCRGVAHVDFPVAEIMSMSERLVCELGTKRRLKAEMVEVDGFRTFQL